MSLVGIRANADALNWLASGTAWATAITHLEELKARLADQCAVVWGGVPRSLNHTLCLCGGASWNRWARGGSRAGWTAELPGHSSDGDGLFVLQARTLVWVTVVAAAWWGWSWWGWWWRWWRRWGWSSTVRADARALDRLASGTGWAATITHLQKLQARFADESTMVWGLGP